VLNPGNPDLGWSKACAWAAGSGRGVGRTASATCARPWASRLSVFANRPVALKVINPALFGHPKFREIYKPQFQVEASLAGKLNHPHIVSIYDAVIGDDAGHIVMEFVAGENLLPYIAGKNLMPVESAIAPR